MNGEGERGSVPKGKKDKKNGQKKEGKLITRWSLIISVMTFFTAIGISLISDFFLSGSSLYMALLVLLMIVSFGLVTDIVAVAVTAVDREPFVAMASKKVYGARKCIHIVRNAEKYSNFFADVVGDVSGYVAGVAGSTIVVRITLLEEGMAGYQSLITVLVAGVTSSLIVGSKAIGKKIALNHKTFIVLLLGKVLTLIAQRPRFLYRKKRRKKTV